MKNKNLQEEINKLKKQVDKTKEEREKFRESNKNLQDEVDSLWAMMDEIAKSDIKNWKHLFDQLKTDAITKTLMTSKHKAEA